MPHQTKFLVLFSAGITLLAIAAAPALAENLAPAAAGTAAVASGTYFARFVADGVTATRKMLLVK